MDTELSRRRRAGWWFMALLMFGVLCGSLAFGTTFWASHPWLMFWLVMALFVVGAVTSNLQLRAALEFRGMYEMLLKDYEDAYDQNAKRGKFMIEFTPTREAVEAVLRSAAYSVLRHHQVIAELHQRGIEVPETGDPETSLEALKRNFSERVRGLEELMGCALKRFRELRDLAAWAGEKRFDVRKSWWDYIDAKDLPKKVKRAGDRARCSNDVASGLARELRDALLEQGSDEDRIHIEGANEPPGQ